MATTLSGLLQFCEHYAKRVWGGDKLETLLGRQTPPDQVTGEAWLVSDHEEHESVVSAGPLAGRSLRQLLEADAAAILGTRASLTPHGRFPLLLKLLDSAQNLSVQVHPDDGDAARLGEPDVGKTEMWHVLASDPGSELVCGLAPGVAGEELASAIQDGTVERLMRRFEAPAGATAFVSAGTVHAIGGGILLAEIQQNSNITYRLYDYRRLGTDGKPRELHVDKALEATHFGSTHGGASTPLARELNGARCHVLGACRYFAAERIGIDGPFERSLNDESFHIVQPVAGPMRVASGDTTVELARCQAVLVPGIQAGYRVEGPGAFLDYYVPNLERDVVAPLRAAGHSDDAIVALGGDAQHSDLARLA